MPLDSLVVGPNTRTIHIIGDPATAAAVLSVGQFHLNDTQSLSASLYSILTGSVPLLDNAAGSFDRQRSAAGTVGIPAVNTEGVKATYSAGVVGFTPAATATDFFQVLGSATKTVRLLRLTISGLSTTVASVDIQLIKRIAVNTGGSPTAATIAQHDTNDGVPTAVVNTYGANPTLGSAGAANVRAQKLNLGAAGAAGTIVWDFTMRNGKGLVLRNVGHSYCLNWNGAAVPSGTSLDIDCEFSEE